VSENAIVVIEGGRSAVEVAVVQFATPGSAKEQKTDTVVLRE
jgi:hypothetical protein